MKLFWTNPFSNKKEILELDSALQQEEGKEFIKIPDHFLGNLLPVWQAGYHGLVDAFQANYPGTTKRLALFILNVLDTPQDHLVRQVSKKIMTSIRDEQKDNKLYKTNTHDAELFIKKSPPSNFGELLKEIEIITFGPTYAKSFPKKTKCLRNEFYHDIIKAFDETHKGNIDEKRHPRKFRERYNSILRKYSISKDMALLIRFEAIREYGNFYNDIAKNFYEAAKFSSPELAKQIFIWLHFSVSLPTPYKNLTSLPPFSSLTAFTPIRIIYQEVFNESLFNDIAKCASSLKSHPQEEINEFIGRIVSTIKWYRSEYMDLATQDDHRKKGHFSQLDDNQNILSQDDSAYFNPYSCSSSEDSLIDLLDLKLGYTQHNNNDFLENDSKSWPDWEKKILNQGWALNDFKKEVEIKCTKKQKEALLLFIELKTSPQDIAKHLNKTRQTINGLLSDGLKKVGKNK